MKKLILTTLLIIGYLVIAVAQKDTIDVDCTTVIAVNGINIRSQPNATSEILGTAPYGGKVKYLSNFSFGVDTIYDYRFLGWSKKYDENMQGDFKFIGKWAKINYKGTIGYVMDAYLYYSTGKNKRNTNNYALLYSRLIYSSDMIQPTDFNWYGLFQNPNGPCELKKVSINYFSTYQKGNNGKSLAVSVGNDQGLLFIIGSKSEMKEGEKNCVDLAHLKEDSSQCYKKEAYGLVAFTSLDEELAPLYDIKGEKKRMGKPYKTYKRLAPNWGEAEFIGDIDGDNEWDYILRTTHTCCPLVYQYVLYLSSEKKGKKIVAPVAFFYVRHLC